MEDSTPPIEEEPGKDDLKITYRASPLSHRAMRCPAWNVTRSETSLPSRITTAVTV
jgi:hypothetical protein